jgi:hypothetical protein
MTAINLSLQELANGIAAEHSQGSSVIVVGDAHSGGLTICPPGTDWSYPEAVNVMCGVRRPELDEFAELIREKLNSPRRSI